MWKYFDLWHFIQNFYVCKAIRIRFDQVYGVIKIYDETRNERRYLELFDCWFYYTIYDNINYLIGGKSNYK